MRKNKLHIISILLLFSFSVSLSAQEKIFELFKTKDHIGHVKLFKDRLKKDVNYLVEMIDLKKSKSIKAIQLLQAQIPYWKSEYNLEIILIEDNFYKDDVAFNQLLKSKDIDIPILRSDGEFKDIKVFFTPYKMIIPANTKQPIRFNASSSGYYERVFIEEFRFSKFESVLDSYFEQYVSTEMCESEVVTKYQNTKDTIIKKMNYHQIGPLLLLEESGKGFQVFDRNKKIPLPYLSYDAGLCSKVTLTDYQGDILKTKIIDIIETDHNIRLVTDKYIQTNCDGPLVPFELIQGVGTNAGLIFDIDDNKVVSKLVCHYQEGNPIYLDPNLLHLCQYNNTSDSPKPPSLRIYPNPTTNNINIDFLYPATRTLYIYSTDGRLVLTTTLHSKKNNISILSLSENNIYYLKIVDKNGNTTRETISVIR